MKLLVVLLVVLAGVWLWQRGRRLGGPPDPHTRRRPKQTLPMVRCARCGTHVTGDEVVAGRQGSYCSADHRRDAEGA